MKININSQVLCRWFRPVVILVCAGAFAHAAEEGTPRRASDGSVAADAGSGGDAPVAGEVELKDKSRSGKVIVLDQAAGFAQGLKAAEVSRDSIAGFSAPSVMDPQGTLGTANFQRLAVEFKASTERYVATQRELSRKLKGATADEKARLRTELAENKEKYTQLIKPIRDQIHEQLQDLKRDLKEHGRPINAGVGEGGGRRRGE